MRAIYPLIFFAIFVLVPIGTISAGEWYEGGTLHNSKVSSWEYSSDSNKLATAADWVASAKKAKNMRQLQLRAATLVICINKAAESAPATEELSSMAAICMVMMGW